MRYVMFFVTIGVVVAALALVGCQPAGEPEGEVTPPAETPAMSDEDAIREVAAGFVTAWNAGDAQAIAAFFTQDGDTMAAPGHFKGRAEVERYYRESLGGVYQGTTITIATTSLRFLEPDVAIGDGLFEISGMKGEGGADLPKLQGKFMNVMTKVGGQWLIACSRPMFPVATPTTTG